MYHSTISYRLRDKGLYLQKKFPTLVYLTPRWGFPLKFYLRRWVMPLSVHRKKNYDNKCICVDKISALDKQTDRQTDRRNWYNNIAFCMHSTLTSDKSTLLLLVSETRSSADADKPARRVYRSVKVTKHSTIVLCLVCIRYSLLLCNSNFVFQTRRFHDIRLQKMS